MCIEPFALVPQQLMQQLMRQLMRQLMLTRRPIARTLVLQSVESWVILKSELHLAWTLLPFLVPGLTA